MNKYIFIFSILLFTSLTFVYFGCKKDKTDTDQRAAMDNSIAENAFNDVFMQVDCAAKETSFAGAKITQIDSSNCETITITPFDSITWPKTLTIDFGSSDCLCSDFKYRRGKIIATLSGRYGDSASVINISLNQYYVNDYLIEGTKTIKNLGRVGTYDNENNLMYSVIVSNAKIIPPNGKTISWNSTRTREWIEGESTATNWMDDVYRISGSAYGIDQNGNSFKVNITTPLRIALNCQWVESGTVEIKPQNLVLRTVDYGNGNCDDQATVTINGTTYNFTMP